MLKEQRTVLRKSNLLPKCEKRDTLSRFGKEMHTMALLAMSGNMSMELMVGKISSSCSLGYKAPV
jgi:hypothetical protein